MSELTEREAIERCQEGDRAAFRWLYDRFSAEVFGFLKRILKDPESAEDACQETFFRLHRSLASVDKERPLRPWVLQVARNVAIDAIRVRRRRARPESIDRVEPSAEAAVLEDATASEAREVVDEAFSALGPEPRTLLALRFLHELSYEELASIEKVTPRTIGNRLRAAVALLTRELVRRGAHNLEVRP